MPEGVTVITHGASVGQYESSAILWPKTSREKGRTKGEVIKRKINRTDSKTGKKKKKEVRQKKDLKIWKILTKSGVGWVELRVEACSCQWVGVSGFIHQELFRILFHFCLETLALWGVQNALRRAARGFHPRRHIRHESPSPYICLNCD